MFDQLSKYNFGKPGSVEMLFNLAFPPPSGNIDEWSKKGNFPDMC